MNKVEMNDFTMILHGDNYLEEKVITTRCWKPATTQVFRELVKPGMTVVDVGANIGYFSLLSASLVGPTGQVHAFEPYPGYQERLKKSLAVNDLPHIRLVPFALSDKVEKHELYKGLASASMHKWTYADPVFNQIHDVVTVRCLPLDEYAKRYLNRIDLIKIDVDGYEMNVLRGGRESLKKYKPVVVIELFEEALVDAGSSVRQLLDFFKELDYVPYSEQGRCLDYDALHLEATRDIKLSVNIVFRPVVEQHVKVQPLEGSIKKLTAGLIIDLPFHEANKWTSATTWHLVEAVRSNFDCVLIQNQSDYELAVKQLDLLISMEPHWGGHRLDLTRTKGLREKIEKIPSYIFYSDPHANKWRQDYFLNNAFDYILSFYYYPIRYHFSKIASDKIIHFPWPIPDKWIGTEPIQYRQGEYLNCFGGQKHQAYMLRNWCRNFDFVESTTNSGCENKVMTEAEYIQWLGEKDACVAAGSDDVIYRLTVPKYYEIAAAGSLLFAQETDDLGLLGFTHGQNCLVFNRTNFESLAREYLKNPLQYLHVRDRGRELIRQRHSLSVRMANFVSHVNRAVQQKKTAKTQIGIKTMIPDISGSEAPRDEFNYWFKKICVPSVLKKAYERLLNWEGCALEWDACHEILAYHTFINGPIEPEKLIALSNGRYELLDRLWPGEPLTQERGETFYRESAKVLPWGHGIFKADHDVQHRRQVWLKRVQLLEMLKKVGATSVCDYGAGGGYTSLLAKTMGFSRVIHHEYTVFHPYVAWREKQISAVDPNHQFIMTQAEQPLKLDAPVDAIICADVAEHVWDPKQMLKDIHAALKSNGYLIWNSVFEGGISCHMHPELKGHEEELLASCGFKRVEDLPVRCVGHSGFYRSVPVVTSTENKQKALNQIQSIEVDKPSNKNKILLIVDKPGWAHDFKADNLIRCLGDDYEIVKRYCDDVQDSEIEASDVVVIFYWKQIPYENMQRRLPTLQRNKHKILMGICSHIELQGESEKPGLSVLRTLASGIFVNSKLLYKQYVDVFDVPVFYTPNGVNREFFRPSSVKKENEKLIVGWAGSLKNHGDKRGVNEFIIPAVKQIQGVELLIAAREDKWPNKEQMREFYQKIDIYICASRTEGTPNPCLEAAACGVPILTTPVGNMPELIQPGANGYFVERDVDQIAQTLHLLKNRRDLLNRTRKGILCSIKDWDWKVKAENYKTMFDSMLARAGSKEDLFQSRGQVYVASADRMDRVLANIDSLQKMPTKKINHYISVVGGLSGLNYLLSVDSAKITFFDLNTHALEYAKLVFELISISADHRDFIGRVFARSVEAFLAQHGQTELTLENQHLYLSTPVDPNIVENTLTSLSASGTALYRTYIQPFHDGQVLEGVRNCRCLLPCYGIHERVPVGGGKDQGHNEFKQLVPNTNSFFYGHGWLQSKETFLRVQDILRKCPIRYLPFNLLNGDLDGLSNFSGRVVIHASNIDEWFKDAWDHWLNSVFQQSVRRQGALYVVTTNGGVVKSDVDAHVKAYVAVAPYVYGRVVEVTHKTQWGFHEFERENILFSNYLDGSHPADTTILHILVGEGLSVEQFQAVYRRALEQSQCVLVLEHNRDSADWTPEKAEKLLSIEQTQSILTSAAEPYQAKVMSVHEIAGERDLTRNALFVVECEGSSSTEQIASPETATISAITSKKAAIIKTLVVYDVEGWAWWHKGQQIKRHLPPDITVDLLQMNRPFSHYDYDFVVVFDPYLISILANVPAEKIIIGCSCPEYLQQTVELVLSARCAAGFVNNRSMFNVGSATLPNLFCCQNGVDEDLFQPSPSMPKEHIACWIGNSGSVGMKGLDLITEACRRTNIRLLPLDREANRDKGKLLTQERVRDSIYHQATFYICASVKEGTPNPALEALACGLPVISTRVGNMPEIIRDGYNGFLVERSVEAIADAIEKLKRLNRDDLARNARLSVLDGWTWRQQAEKYTHMFRALSKTVPQYMDIKVAHGNVERGNMYVQRYPTQVHFLMIDKCNAKCIMCGGDYFKSKSGRMITLKKFKTMAANLKLENARAIVLAGAGDPLLNKELVPIIQFVKKTYPHIIISVTTNGIALSEKISGLLLESGVSLVNISINSATRASYKRIMQVDGFDLVCKNAKNFVKLKKLLSKQTTLQFSAALNRLNIEDLPVLVELAREIGVNGINLFYTRFYPERIRNMSIENPADVLNNKDSLFFHQTLSDEIVEKAKIQAQKYGINLSHEPLFKGNAPAPPCTWAFSQVMVGFDGEIYPCGGSEVHFKEKVERGIYNFGNALTESIDSFWNNDFYQALRMSSKRGKTCITPECRCCANALSPNDVGAHIMEWDKPIFGKKSQSGDIIKETETEFSKDSDPLVSVIVPTYNRPDMLAEALKSILKQTFQDFEIVVVNDAGMSVEDVVSKLNTEKKIAYVSHAGNRGLAAARNTGIRVARGKYIALLDDDDLFYPNHLETAMVHVSEETPVIYTDATRVTYERDGDSYKFVGKSFPYSIDFERNKLLMGNISPVNCFVFEKEKALQAGLFDETLTTLEDWEFWIRLSEHWAFKHITEVTAQVNWRTDGTTMTSSRGTDFKKNRNKIYNRYKEQINKIDDTESILKEFSKIWKAESKPGLQLVSIVILAHNQLAYTKKCINSIFTHTKAPFELIMVDNGSTDGTVEYLETEDRGRRSDVGGQRAEVRIIKNKENLGFAAGNNQGMAAARGNYILLMNNDIVVTPGWLERMISCAEKNPNIGIVGPMSNYVSGPQLVENVTYDIQTLNGLEDFATKFSDQHVEQSQRFLRVVGFCMLIKRAVINRIGGMDAGYGLGNFEDDDFSLRATLAGFESWIAKDCFIHHFGSRTFVGAKIDYTESLNRNWEIFKEKWGFPKEMPYGSYNATEILKKGFIPEKHYYPLPGEPASTIQKATGQVEDDAPIQPQVVFKKEMAPGMVSIIIPVANTSNYLKKCVSGINAHTPMPYEILFVDNGCKSGTLKWIRQAVKRKSNYRLIKVGKNSLLSKSYNMGMEASSGEYIIFLRDHVIVADGWLDGMLKCINRAEDVGIVGSMTNAKSVGVQCVADSGHVGIDQLEKYAGAFSERNRHRRVPSREVADVCMLFRRSLVEKIGSFDEELEQGSVSDDYCLRAALEGYNNLIAGDVFVFCGDLPPKGNKRFFDYKWRDIDAKSHNGERLGVLNAIRDAEDLYQREEVDKAIVKVVDGLKYRPDEEAIYHRLAEMLIDCERFNEGLDAINSIPEDKRDSARTLELTGYCKAGLELYDEAAQCADRALSLNGSSAPALNLMGVLAHIRGDKGASEDFFKRAIASDTGYGEAYTNLGILVWEAGRKEEALEILEKGFVLSPTAEDSRTAYLSAISETAEFERAEGVFREAKALYPQSRRIAFLLIDLLIRQEKYDSAQQDIREALLTFGINDGILSAAQAVLDRFDAQEERKDTKKKPALSLCMIVKDEEDCLAKCLMSAIPVVDEIIIVDTGSTDRTKAIAKTFGARVYDFEWTDDFSEARNLSLSKATGNWILVLDADEVISPLDYDRLTKIAKNNPEPPKAYSINTKNYVKPPYVIGWTCNSGEYPDEEEGTGWYPSWKVRLFPNDNRIRFENPVHELVEPALKRNDIQITKSDIPVHHYGQIDREHYVAKGDKYYQLGKKKLEEKGDDLQSLVELATQAGGEFGKYEEAVDLWKRVLQIDHRNTKALVNMGGALLKLEKYEATRTASKMAMTLDPGLKEAVIIYTTCEVLIGDVGKTIPILENLLKEVPEYPLALAILAAAYGIEGEREKGMEQIRSITRMGFKSADYLYDISERLISSGKTDRAVSLLEFAVECGKGTREIRSLLSELRG
jgi:FkbM family methyltransferase